MRRAVEGADGAGTCGDEDDYPTSCYVAAHCKSCAIRTHNVANQTVLSRTHTTGFSC